MTLEVIPPECMRGRLNLEQSEVYCHIHTGLAAACRVSRCPNLAPACSFINPLDLPLYVRAKFEPTITKNKSYATAYERSRLCRY